MNYLLFSNVLLTVNSVFNSAFGNTLLGVFWLNLPLLGYVYGLFSFLFPSHPYSFVKITDNFFESYFAKPKTQEQDIKEVPSLDQLRLDAKNLNITFQEFLAYLKENESNLKPDKSSGHFIEMLNTLNSLIKQFNDLSLSPSYRYFFKALFIMNILFLNLDGNLEPLKIYVSFLESLGNFENYFTTSYFLSAPAEFKLYVINIYDAMVSLINDIEPFFKHDSTLLSEEDKVYIKNDEKQNFEAEKKIEEDKNSSEEKKVEKDKNPNPNPNSPAGWVAVTGLIVGCLCAMIYYSLK
jgi:hypothetical protein